jgi:TetR/AcrR family transcriptional regulator, cholesterol catabolism regulator
MVRLVGRPPGASLTRDQVLDAALAVFAEHGYRSTSLTVVASELGVTRQALYHHFRSKSEILAVLFDRMMTKLEETAARVERGASDPGAPMFTDLVHAHARTTAENCRLVGLLVHERPRLAQLPSAASQQSRRRRYMELFSSASERGVRSGLYAPADSRIVVNTVLSATNAMSSWLQAPATHGIRREPPIWLFPFWPGVVSPRRRGLPGKPEPVTTRLCGSRLSLLARSQCVGSFKVSGSSSRARRRASAGHAPRHSLRTGRGTLSSSISTTMVDARPWHSSKARAQHRRSSGATCPRAPRSRPWWRRPWTCAAALTAPSTTPATARGRRSRRDRGGRLRHHDCCQSEGRLAMHEV